MTSIIVRIVGGFPLLRLPAPERGNEEILNLRIIAKVFWEDLWKIWKLLCTCEESTGCSLSTDLWRQPLEWRYWNMAWPNSQFDVWIFFFWDCFSTLPDNLNDQGPLMDCQWWWGRTWLWPGRWKPSLTRWPLHQPGEEWELLDSPARGTCFWIRWIGNSPCRA